MRLKNRPCVSRNVINSTLPPSSIDHPFRTLRSSSSSPTFSMRRAMSLRQETTKCGRQANLRVIAPGTDSRSLYPQLDVKRFHQAFSLNPSGRGSNNNGAASERGEQQQQPRTLKDVLASTKRRSNAVFGIGLGMEDHAVEEIPGPSFQQAAEEADLKEEREQEEHEYEGILAEEELDMKEEEEEEEEEVEDIVAEEAAADETDSEIPTRPLTFHMSRGMFVAARASAPESPESYWSHTMYERVQDDGTIDKVKVHYCTDRESMERVCKAHFLDEPVLGFDLEWMVGASRYSGPRENISVIQIASQSHVGLFHVALFPEEDDDLAAPTFRKIMRNHHVSKVGVNVLADSTRLTNHLQVSCRGIFELSHLYRLVKFLPQNKFELINRKPVALATQVEDQLGLPLFKGDQVRRSNWMKRLSESQLLYSASDAYASFQLYHALESKREALDPPIPRPAFAEFGRCIYEKPDASKQTYQTAAEDVQMEKEENGDSLVDQMVAELDTFTISVETPTTTSSPPPSSKPSKPKPQKSSSPSPAPPPSSDPRLLAAELQIAQYCSSKENPPTTTPSSLRAYYLWAADDSLTPETIAGLLRDPPLQASTVVTYITKAIVDEKFPFSKERARRDLLPLIHPQVFKQSRRFGSFLMACRESGEEEE